MKAEPEVFLPAMRAELERTRALRLEGYPAPYFVAYALDDNETREINGRFGALLQNRSEPSRQLYIEVRVGDYHFDNTAGRGEPFEINFDVGYQPLRLGPLDANPSALRALLWLLSDDQYKAAAAAYLKKKGKRIYQLDPSEREDSFSKEQPVKARLPAPALTWDRAGKGVLAQKLSAMLGRSAHVFDHDVHFFANRKNKYLVTSEGTELVSGRTIYAAQVNAFRRASDGILLEAQRSYYAATEARLPAEKELVAATLAVERELEELAKAKLIDPYTGPAILAPEAAGVLFHEALGHRLEGERQKDDVEGQTFKGQVGQLVLPAFLDVWDDPTLPTFGGKDLNGNYRYDDEGVPAERVTLVSGGVLKSFLLSRTPIDGFAKSNGHGRGEGGQKPQARMGTTIVGARKSVSFATLKKMLIEEAKRQGKPYGLILKDVSGGQTNTESGGYQAFKGSPRMVYLVDVKTGEERLVRGVELVGTPLTALSRVLAASDESQAFNGYCGAESGFVPVSTIAPALLLSEIELQRSQKEKQRPPLLPKPF